MLTVEKSQPTWTIPQMQCSMELLARLMDEEQDFPEEQLDLLVRAITRLDYNRVSSNGILHLQAAYWKARRRGLLNPATQPAQP